ncbi:MAG: CCDC90 family protein [Acidobacteria bacterium]|nr:CCDC90 family protein [Acidobacteriota bacterium]
MTSATFDTHKFVRRLKEAGFPEDQAEAISDAFKEAQGEAELVTKKDLQLELAPIKADITLMKWMLGLILGGIVALIANAFFR